jgi:hypothetical protein
MFGMAKNLENIPEDLFIVTVVIVKIIGKKHVKIQKLQENGKLQHNK